MKVKTRDFGKKFDESADISRHLDIKKHAGPNRSTKNQRRFSRVDDVLSMRSSIFSHLPYKWMICCCHKPNMKLFFSESA